jgi:hypothetical protein
MIRRFAGIVGALVLVTIAFAIFVGWLLAHPVQTAIGNPPADLNAEPVTFASDSSATVHGWWCPIQNANGAVLLLPGIRANRLSMVERARFLHRAGYSVLLIDFQATGNNKIGPPNTRNCEAKNCSNGLEVACSWPRILCCNVLRTLAGPLDSFPDKGADQCR